MDKTTDLYDSHYSKVEEDVYKAIREEAFGEDIGQTSWITALELEQFGRLLELKEGQKVLEIACGSGGASVHLAKTFGVTVVGTDINQSAIVSSEERAKREGLSDKVTFQIVNADESLPFPDESFDVVFCNDAINHFQNREKTLAEWNRVLRSGGHCFYTDPIIVTGALTNEEIKIRSSIGFFLFVPEGFNEKCLENTNFTLLQKTDLTESVYKSAKNWHKARKKREKQLIRLEGKEKYADLQNFLETVYKLAGEKMLSRFAFMGQK